MVSVMTALEVTSLPMKPSCPTPVLTAPELQELLWLLGQTQEVPLKIEWSQGHGDFLAVIGLHGDPHRFALEAIQNLARHRRQAPGRTWFP